LTKCGDQTSLETIIHPPAEGLGLRSSLLTYIYHLSFPWAAILFVRVCDAQQLSAQLMVCVGSLAGLQLQIYGLPKYLTWTSEAHFGMGMYPVFVMRIITGLGRGLER